jgi:hypothetical protein
MRIVAFDPGGTTGIAIFDDTHDEASWTRMSLGPDEHHAALWSFLAMENHIVYETFDYQRRDVEFGVSLELISREYIGIIKLHKQYSEDGGDPPEVKLYPQKPAQRMFWTDEKLKTLGLWVSSEHERDATRHLLYHLCFTLNDKRYLYALQP